MGSVTRYGIIAYRFIFITTYNCNFCLLHTAGYEKGWQDFLCGNHSRNLPIDAFNRRFEAYMKATLGPDLEAAKSRGGGFSRVEPSGTQILRSICKLTHIGRKQYAKGNVLLIRFFRVR